MGVPGVDMLFLSFALYGSVCGAGWTFTQMHSWSGAGPSECK